MGIINKRKSPTPLAPKESSENIIITHSERALFNLNARVEARGTIVPKAVGRGYYGPERRHKGI